MNLRSRLTAMLSAIMIMFSLSPVLVMAADCANPASAKEAIKCGSDSAAGKSNEDPKSLDVTVTRLLNVLSTVVGVVAVVMIIVSGLRYITSGGDAEKVKTAKKALLYAIIGLAIVALTQTIVHLVLTEAGKA